MTMGLRGGIGVMVVMAMMMVMGAQVEAQEVRCLTVQGASAPFADAAALVQELRERPGLCCPNGSPTGSPTGSGVCIVVETAGNAAASLGGSCTTCAVSELWSPCPSCAEVGNNLNQVLSQCNRNNTVQGAYSPGVSSESLLFLTSITISP